MTKKLILIVDDDPICRHLIQGFLKNNKDYTVQAVESGNECLDFVEQNNVDLIISDVLMEELNGIEMSKILLSRKETSDIPIILSSIKDKVDVTRKSRDFTNVKKVTQKPYDRDVLLSDVKKFISN